MRLKQFFLVRCRLVFRIIYLGDSCTQQGFPGIIERLLNYFFGTDSLRFECITLAVSGYSSYQGKVMAEMYGGLFEPDLVVVLFGWNDHWQAYHSIDSKTKSMLERDITKDIDILRDNMARARSREDVVYAALEILALAVNRDVIVEGRFNGSPKRVSNLWKS